MVVKESYKGLYINKQYCTEELMHKRLYDYWIGCSFINGLFEEKPEDLRQ